MSSRIVFISTGGTIATRKTDGQNPLSGKELLATAPEAREAAELEVVEFGNIPSFQVAPEIMLKLAKEVERQLQREDVDGVVITHGTDTMEETAYFLDLWLDSEKPVCVTGAMRKSDYLGADGPANIHAAIRAAALPRLRGYGVLLVFNDEIHAARLVHKMHRSAVETFASPNWGPVGRIDQQGITVRWPALPRELLRSEAPLKEVAIVKCYSGMDGGILECLTPAEMDGLILEGLGIGNVPKSIVPVIRDFLDKGLPVVATSSVPLGRVAAEYSAEGGGRQLEAMGVILAGELNSGKARIKLMLALGVTSERQKLAEIFKDKNREIDRPD